MFKSKLYLEQPKPGCKNPLVQILGVVYVLASCPLITGSVWVSVCVCVCMNFLKILNVSLLYPTYEDWLRNYTNQFVLNRKCGLIIYLKELSSSLNLIGTLFWLFLLTAWKTSLIFLQTWGSSVNQQLGQLCITACDPMRVWNFTNI